MKYKRYSKTKNLMLVTIVILGSLSPFVLLTQNADAKAIPGLQLIAEDDNVIFDVNGNGLIDLDGDDHIGMRWYQSSVDSDIIYYKVNSDKREEINNNRNAGEKIYVFNIPGRNNFVEGRNTIKVWYGSKRPTTGYSTVTFSLPASVKEDFPIDFTEGKTKTFSTFKIFQDILFRFPIFNRVLNILW
jgi:hypothetical protein